MKGMICAKCGKIAAEASLRFQGHDIKGWKCACGEEYFDGAEAERLLLFNKLQHIEFPVKLGQMRSNLILRIPKEAQRALGLRKGETLRLKIGADGKIALRTA